MLNWSERSPLLKSRWLALTRSEKYKLHEQTKEFEQLNHTLKMENEGLKQELEYANSESNKHLFQVYRLQQRIDEIKRAENEEFYKIKLDEVKLKKSLDELKLKLQRSQDEVSKYEQKEDEVEDMKQYFSEKKQKEEDERVYKLLKFEKEKHSILGIMRLKDKQPILCLIDYLEMHEINKLAMLNKAYRNTMCNECTFIWKSAYRNVNLSHQDQEQELQRQIVIKTQQLKSIIPQKEFDIFSIDDPHSEIDLRELLQKYIVEEQRVGECIQNTMYNTKIFINKQYGYMQKLFKQEQERIKQERQRASAQEQPKSAGLFGKLFSGFAKPVNAQAQPQQQPAPQQPSEVIEKPEGNTEHYLMSTTESKPVEEAKLIDFDEEDSKEEETEVPVKMDDKEIQDDEETKQSETETINDERSECTQEVNKPRLRNRSDSISSTSTSRLYSYNDFNDFVNIDELHKFMYKCGAMLVNERGKMEEWIDWMQRTLSEYYVYSQVVYKQAKDVEILKDFLSKKLQSTKYELDQVSNEKEDLIERQEAEAGIKEYLAKQVQDLNVKHIEKTHELVMVKQKLSEVTSDIKDIEEDCDSKIRENNRQQYKLSKELKSCRKRLKILDIENAEYKEIFDEMQNYMGLVRRTQK